MNKEILRHLLLSQLDVIQAFLMMLDSEVSSDGACTHPEASRVPAATMGKPNGWICGICDYNGEG